MAVFLLLVVDLAIVGALLYTLEPLITLLRRNEDLFTPTVTLPLNGTAGASYYSGDLDRQKIPRILHQTTANSTIPDKWVKSQQSCRETYSDFEYKVSQTMLRNGGKRGWFSAECACSLRHTSADCLELLLTGIRPAVDRRVGSRLHLCRISLVRGELGWLCIPYPARRCHPLLRSPPLWRHLPRHGYFLQRAHSS